MSVTFDMIHGLAFGIEYVGKNLEDEIDETVVIVELGFIRAIIWTGDYE